LPGSHTACYKDLVLQGAEEVFVQTPQTCTLAELVSASSGVAPAELERRFSYSVLLVALPSDEWDGESTSVTLEDKPPAVDAPGRAITPIVVPLVRGKLSNENKLVVGRASICDVVLQSRQVSKVHAYLIETFPNQWVVEDAKSTNGTSVEGKKIEPGKRIPLTDGCTLGFGSVQSVFWHGHSFVQHVLRARSGAT
jgi:hypothetical protein